MAWKAANEQQQEALWRNFLMFVVMALVVIRTGLVSRGIVAILSAQSAPQDAAPQVNHHPSTARPVDLDQATLAALLLAEVAGQLYILNARTVWELMNRPPPRPAEERQLDVAAGLCERPAQRLDTS